MNPNTSSAPPILPFRTRDILLGTLLLSIAVTVAGVASYFRLSSETACLRESAMTGLDGNWDKKIAVNVGFFTTSLVRAGSRFFNLPAEARAAFDSIRGAEVGIYKLQGTAGWVDHGAILARADKAMSARRWDRIIGVSRENELVAVYLPRRNVSLQNMRCCVLVLQGRDLIVTGASGRLDPLLQIAQQHFDLKDATRQFALR